MQALRHTEDANLNLCGAKRRSQAAFRRSCALESTATGTMLSARRSRFFASEGRRTRPLLRREERRRTTLAFSAQPSNSSGKKEEKNLSAKMQALRHTEDANLKLSGARRLVAGSFRQEPRFGEHCYRHNAQCAKKQLLPLREPQSAAAAET
ncbi:unnamed protein product [Coccothraustes coccothraustes]